MIPPFLHLTLRVRVRERLASPKGFVGTATVVTL